jgi:hypothetical protein
MSTCKFVQVLFTYLQWCVGIIYVGVNVDIATDGKFVFLIIFITPTPPNMNFLIFFLILFILEFYLRWWWLLRDTRSSSFWRATFDCIWKWKVGTCQFCFHTSYNTLMKYLALQLTLSGCIHKPYLGILILRPVFEIWPPPRVNLASWMNLAPCVKLTPRGKTLFSYLHSCEYIVRSPLELSIGRTMGERKGASGQGGELMF